MNIAVIGTGYVGLVVGACMAETGNNVICVDIDNERVKQLQNGIIPIHEPGLDVIVKRNCDAGRLTFTTDTAEAVSKSKIVFLAVPTPMDEDGSADLAHVLTAARTLAPAINDYKIIVNKSTVPVGTAQKVKEVISELTDQPFDVASNPEFTKEGSAIDDFMKPDRIVIGCDNPKSEEILRNLYSPYVRTGHPILVMKIESAELTKYAANAFLATKISYINEMSRMCELVGADIGEVRQGIGTDKRIGNEFLFPGMGFGGSCFPKDLRAINFIGQSHGMDLLVIQAAIKANEIQKDFIPSKIQKRYGKDLKGLKFAIWGAAFKANTDDIRESPALHVIDLLLDLGASISIYDPEALKSIKRDYGDKLNYCSNSYEALDNSDALVIATEWNEFRRPNFEKMLNLMKQKVIFDGRNLYKAQAMKERGFEYYGVGQV